MQVQVSAIRANVHRKKRCRPIFGRNRYSLSLRTFLHSDSNLRFRLFESDHRAAIIGGEAIRSVSHLVLAHDEPMSQFTNFRTERSGSTNSRPCSLRLGFLGQPFYYHTRSFWQTRKVTNSAPIPPQAGPENLQCRAAFIQRHRAMVPAKPASLPSPTLA
jgi:hypothetical protein